MTHSPIGELRPAERGRRQPRTERDERDEDECAAQETFVDHSATHYSEFTPSLGKKLELAEPWAGNATVTLNPWGSILPNVREGP